MRQKPTVGDVIVGVLAQMEGDHMKAGVLTTEAAQAAGTSEGYVRRELRRMLEQGRIAQPGRGLYSLPVGEDSGAVQVREWELVNGKLIQTENVLSVEGDLAAAGWEPLSLKISSASLFSRIVGKSEIYRFMMMRYSEPTPLATVYQNREFTDGPYVLRLGSGLQVLWLKEIGIGRVAVWNRDTSLAPIFALDGSGDVAMEEVELHAEIVEYSDVP